MTTKERCAECHNHIDMEKASNNWFEHKWGDGATKYFCNVECINKYEQSIISLLEKGV